MSHTPQNVEQPQLANNNLPTNPQQIDTQLQELMKQIEALKAQREAYEKASKQEQGLYNEQLYLHEMINTYNSTTYIVTRWQIATDFNT